jgi:signal peptidase I
MSEVAPVAEHRTETARVEELAHHTSVREYVESLLVTVILALFGTTFVVQAFKITSQSMEPTLLVGDHLLVNKFIFGGRDAWYEKLLPYRAVRRGDVIVFKFPFQDHPHYVKRVIGAGRSHKNCGPEGVSQWGTAQ